MSEDGTIGYLGGRVMLRAGFVPAKPIVPSADTIAAGALVVSRHGHQLACVSIHAAAAQRI